MHSTTRHPTSLRQLHQEEHPSPYSDHSQPSDIKHRYDTIHPRSRHRLLFLQVKLNSDTPHRLKYHWQNSEDIHLLSSKPNHLVSYQRQHPSLRKYFLHQRNTAAQLVRGQTQPRTSAYCLHEPPKTYQFQVCRHPYKANMGKMHTWRSPNRTKRCIDDPW